MNRWCEKENEFLKVNYSNQKSEFLMSNLPNRAWKSIQQQASNLKLKRDLKTRHARLRIGSVEPLLEETPVAYYWIGFLLADGHFSSARINLTLSIKDKQHLKEFCKFIGTNLVENLEKNICYTRLSDTFNVPKLMNKFKIVNRKTYFPCKLNVSKNLDLMFSLCIGFIDGDGSIQRKYKSKTSSIF